jgi:quercetin dioxygenase-like cupin family protein
VSSGASAGVDPILLGPGEGEVVRDRPESFLQIKAGLDELALTEFRYAEGESGPALHIHHEHVDAFWVLDGQLLVVIGGEQVTAAAGSFVLAPPEVVHTFRNDGPGDARFLNIHAPSKGFHRLIRGEKVDFDQADPPPDGGRPASEAVVRQPGEGKAFAIGSGQAIVKAGRRDGGGRVALMETTLPPGAPGPPPHRHPETLDSFYVLEGTLTVQLAGRTFEAGPGSYAAAPAGAEHTFSNPTEEPVRMLNLMVPGGLEPA